MAAQNGKDLLVKIDMDGNGDYQTVAGLRASRISFNAESVDVTTLESAGGWRELLPNAGLSAVSSDYSKSWHHRRRVSDRVCRICGQSQW